MNNPCETCGGPITTWRKNRANRFCSLTCYHASGPHGNRVEKPTAQRMKRVPDHPLAPPCGVVAEARIVLYEKIGPGTHTCHWCHKLVTWMPGQGLAHDAILADHLDWNIHDNSPGNLVPSCNPCNAHRTKGGGRNLIQPDELFVVAKNGVRHRVAERNCEKCGRVFLARLAFIKRGHGRFCSRECSGHGTMPTD